MAWQEQTFREVCSRLPAAASVDVFGSAADPSPVDGWSDLDLHLRLPAPVELVGLFGPSVIWAAEISEAPNGDRSSEPVWPTDAASTCGLRAAGSCRRRFRGTTRFASWRHWRRRSLAGATG